MIFLLWMSKSGKNDILNRNYLFTPTDDQTTLFCRPRDLMLHHCLFLCDNYMLLSAFVENAIQSSIANSIKAQTILGWYPDFSSCYAVYQTFEDQLFKRRFATQFPRHLLSLSALYPMCKLSGNQARMRERNCICPPRHRRGEGKATTFAKKGTNVCTAQ